MIPYEHITVYMAPYLWKYALVPTTMAAFISPRVLFSPLDLLHPNANFQFFLVHKNLCISQKNGVPYYIKSVLYKILKMDLKFTSVGLLGNADSIGRWKIFTNHLWWASATNDIPSSILGIGFPGFPPKLWPVIDVEARSETLQNEWWGYSSTAAVLGSWRIKAELGLCQTVMLLAGTFAYSIPKIEKRSTCFQQYFCHL